MKSTALSPANIAFIKYWGRKNHELFLPLTTTNSMNLDACTATTTIEFSDDYETDEITIIGIDGKEKKITKQDGEKDEMLFKTLERGRQLSGNNNFAKVISKLSFPLSAGIASSAAGMSAFVAAMFDSLEMKEKVKDKAELSREVRLSGSVSAARSVEDGFTELLYGETHEEAYTRKIASPEHWDLVDIVAVLDAEEKKISSSLGHKLADTSPFFKARIEYLKGKPGTVRQAILDKDFNTLAEYSEIDAINMHAVMMTSNPPAYYFAPGTIDIIKQVGEWRQSGIEVFFTIDAGPNPHLITTSKFASEVDKLLQENKFVNFTILNKPARGVYFTQEHNF